MPSALRLCYVDEPWAYFSTRDPRDVSGDDWNDIPYEYNAGKPQGDDVVKVAYDGPLLEPCHGHLNSPWSVIAINQGTVPWLRLDPFSRVPVFSIWAGTTLQGFRALVEKAGGRVYEHAQ